MVARENGRGTVEVERQGGVELIRLLGEHDMATAPMFREALERSVSSDQGVVVSLSEAEFIDSTVINTLFEGDGMLRERGQRLVVHVNTASVVRRLLEVTNVCDQLPWSGEIEAAISLASAREGEHLARSGP